MSARGRRLAAAGGVVVVAVAVLGWLLLRGDSPAESTLDRFLSAYEARDYEAAARLTDGDPAAVSEALEANVDGLDGAALDASVAELDESGERASATVSMSWQVPGIGEFSYENPELRLVAEGDDWRLRWADDVVHPDLDSPGTRLGTDRSFFERAPIVDREGSKLVIARPVVEIGVIPAKLREPAAAVAAIADSTGADAAALRRSIRAAADEDNFVPAITLRAEEYGRVRQLLNPIRGIEFGARELPLAPTREFARALLGTVGPITAEQLGELGDPYAVGDNVGQSGLEAAYERRLAGTPRRSVITRLADGSPVDTLMRVEGERGRPLRITLDGAAQVAAERALGDTREVEALVAVEPSSGDVLAAASRPVDDAFNRAFEGRYPPGSTFKVVSTEALLAAGSTPTRPSTARRRSPPADARFATSRAARPGRCHFGAISPSRATRPSSRSPTAWPRATSPRPGGGSASGANTRSASRPSRARFPRPPTRRSGRPR
ncbi:MAG: hypothetical protein GEU88_04405 [Solirubrobacterales bacterium]|nr:hypothetical protein [Solirubrobacterales bacterium]